MIGVDLKYCSEILHALINVSDLFEGTASDIKSSSVRLVYFHELVTVLDSFFMSLLFKKR